MFGTTGRTTSGVSIGVNGISGSCGIEGAAGVGDSFGVVDVLRGAALDFVSDDPIGRGFGGGGRVCWYGSGGPGDRAGGSVFFTVSVPAVLMCAPAGVILPTR